MSGTPVRRPRWLLTLVLLPLAVSPAGAAPPSSEFVIHAWQRQHGLPENMVKAVCQTRDGYLWIATYAGVARFDGFKFTVFNGLDLPVLPSDACKTLAEDSVGNLWIGTEKGLVRWTGAEATVFTTTNGLSSDDIRLLLAGQSNSLWIATSHGLDRFCEGNIRSFTVQDGLRSPFVGAMYEDPLGRLWFTTIRGVQYWTPATAGFEDCVNYLVAPDLKYLPGPWSNCPLTGRQGALWLARRPERNGVFMGLALLTCTNDPAVLTQALRGEATGRLFTYLDDSTAPIGLIECLLTDHDGNVWLGTERNGLFRFRDGNWTRFGRAEGLTDDWIMCLFEDREGDLWIGTRRGGLNRLQRRRFESSGVEEGLAHTKAWTICEGRNGRVWIGTDGGLSYWQDGRFTNYGVEEGLTNLAVRALHEDATGKLWIGTGDGLFSLYDGCITNERPMPHGMFKVRALTTDRSGNLWVGWEKGLLQRTNGQWRNFTTKEGLPHNDVRAILEDQRGALWLGTFGGGVIRWQDGHMTHFTTREGLASNFAWTLQEDADGVLWIGTESGLTRHENGRFTSYTIREGLFDNLINQILEDERGWLWFSCDRGIFRVSKRELNDVAAGRARSVHSIAYSEADGLRSAETNGRKSQPAGIRTHDGRLWFPTAKGVAIVDPATLDYEEVPPPVVIEEVTANGRLVFSNARASVADATTNDFRTALSNPKLGTPNLELHLPPGGARLLAFHQTANCLAAPDRVRFKYRLLGSHSEWIDAGPRRVAHYTNLRPGHYRYQVIACNQHGVWNETGASFAFYLTPYFYETWWFYTLCGAALAVLGLMLLRWRLNQLHRIQALEAHARISRELARISSDLHDSLGGTLSRHTHLLTQTRREAAHPGALREHLDSLERSTRDALQNLKEIIWATNPRCDTPDHLVTFICEYAARALEPAGIHCRFDVPVALPDCEMPAAVRHHVFLIVKEALHNIVRHAAASEVSLRATTGPSLLHLAIEDNGVGFNPSPSPMPPRAADRGNGLANMQQRMQHCGGRLTVTSACGQGTKIQLEIPLSQPGRQL